MKRKLTITDLKVQSFVTSVDQTEISNVVHGGGSMDNRVSVCLRQTACSCLDYISCDYLMCVLLSKEDCPVETLK